MAVNLSPDALTEIQAHLESAYPGEGAGFLFGTANENHRTVHTVLKLSNARAAADQHNRYLLTPQDVLHSEQRAARLGLDVIGVFHSHPDSPNQPSEFDRAWALPWYSYLITRVQSGQAVNTRAWRLTDNRERFWEEEMHITARP